jgi:hypothetical protein
MKNFLQLKIHFAILFIVISVLTVEAQRKSAPGKVAAPAKTAEGVLYFVGSGNAIISCVLQTDAGAIDFDATNKTRYVGFSPKSEDDAAWHLGARWRVSYSKTKDGTTAESITYLGEVKAVADAEKLARSFLGSLSDNDFKTAYARLSPTAKQNLNLDDFTKMYKPIEFSMNGVIICSQTDDAVKILLAPHGADGGDLYQPAEIVQLNGKSFVNKLGTFQDTYKGCGSLK